GAPASLTLNAGAFNDTVVVTDTASATPMTLNLGAGKDVVNVGSPSNGPLDAIASPVAVNGQAGSDAVVVADYGPPAPLYYSHYYTITRSDVTRNNRQILVYDTAESLTVQGGAGADDFLVASTRAETPVVILGGLGRDFVNMSFLSTATHAGALTLD